MENAHLAARRHWDGEGVILGDRSRGAGAVHRWLRLRNVRGVNLEVAAGDLEAALTDGHVITLAQRCLALDFLVVDLCAVAAPQIGDGVAVRSGLQLRVEARDERVAIEIDLAAWRAAHAQLRPIELELAPDRLSDDRRCQRDQSGHELRLDGRGWGRHRSGGAGVTR